MSSIFLHVHNVRSTCKIASLLARASRPGDVFCLHGCVSKYFVATNAIRGIIHAFLHSIRCQSRLSCFRPVGVGKSEFIRQFIRTRMLQPTLLVPSPTFALKQTYAIPDSALRCGLLLHKAINIAPA
jgi:tRNA A37 threonylcarbamoyladenosine biosynthesis protein TsaE